MGRSDVPNAQITQFINREVVVVELVVGGLVQNHREIDRVLERRHLREDLIAFVVVNPHHDTHRTTRKGKRGNYPPH